MHRILTCLSFILGLLCTLQATAQESRKHLPVIDMHLHANVPDGNGPPPLAMCTPLSPRPAWDPATPYSETFLALLKHPQCKDPIWSPVGEDELRERTLAELEKHNVIGVLSADKSEYETAWRKAAPERIIPAGPSFLNPLQVDAATAARVKALKDAGNLVVLGEIGPQYEGIAPDDARLEPFWKMAEDLDLPVGIHVGTGPPGAPYLGPIPDYRARLHSALGIEEVLVKHPKLRVYLMHAGYPFLDDLLAVLYAHPQAYVDIAVIVYTLPRAEFYRYLRTIVEAGYGNRVMFGSDNMNWPETIGRSIQVIEEAPFLSEAQKRDILYDNAARFLRLDDAAIRRHHAL
ncbi:MAG: amidohydrolase family protein [Pseudoxanthomonas sp.]